MAFRRSAAGGRPRATRWAPAVLLAGILVGGQLTLAPSSAAAGQGTGSYRNPLNISSDVGAVENCADPTVLKDEGSGATDWYMYCTKDPRNDDDRDTQGDLVFQRIPIYHSTDLVNWTYEGNVFNDANYPDWAIADAGLFAPEIRIQNGQYYLYYSVTDVTDATSGEPNCGNDFAIGVATAPSAAGPWTDSGDPVVDPRRGGPGCNFFWTIDPEVITTGGQRYMFFGSYYGGIFLRDLSLDGLETDAQSQVPITTGNKFEGAEVIRKDGYWYLFVSATNCCNGPLTGYSVFAGRSQDLDGPYRDKDGVSLYDDGEVATDPTDGRVGGTPVLSMNGNRWVGPGHNTVFKDYDNQWWTIYHAVQRSDPYFEGEVGFTKRPPLLDPIVWIDGWPQVRAGRWASSTTMQAPAAQPGEESSYTAKSPWRSRPGRLLAGRSDEFNGSTLGSQWSWVRQPSDSSTYGVGSGVFRFDSQKADLYVDSNNASVLVQDAPDGEYIVQARVRLNVPAEGCCFNYTQAGLVIYGDDDNFVKLVHFSNWETRQTEFAKEVSPVPAGYPRYGNTIVGAPGEWTTLRIVKFDYADKSYYQAWTRRQGGDWVRGGVWQHDLGANERIGLVSMAEPGDAEFSAQFDWVRVYRLDIRPPGGPGSF